jgi:RNA polymerase sigma factor FliA
MTQQLLTSQDNKEIATLVQQFSPHIGRRAAVLASRLKFVPSLDKERLISAGLTAVFRGYLDYKTRGHDTNLEAFLYVRIRWEMYNEIRSATKGLRLPRQQLLKYNKAIKDLTQELGREVSTEELASHLGVTYAEADEFLGRTTGSNIVSITGFEEVLCERKTTLSDPSDTVLSVEKQAQQSELMDFIDRAMPALTEQERDIIQCHFWNGMTLAEIGDKYGVTKQRIGQIKDSALAKIRWELIEMGIEPDDWIEGE